MSAFGLLDVIYLTHLNSLIVLTLQMLRPDGLGYTHCFNMRPVLSTGFFSFVASHNAPRGWNYELAYSL